MFKKVLVAIIMASLVLGGSLYFTKAASKKQTANFVIEGVVMSSQTVDPNAMVVRVSKQNIPSIIGNVLKTDVTIVTTNVKYSKKGKCTNARYGGPKICRKKDKKAKTKYLPVKKSKLVKYDYVKVWGVYNKTTKTYYATKIRAKAYAHKSGY